MSVNRNDPPWRRAFLETRTDAQPSRTAQPPQLDEREAHLRAVESRLNADERAYMRRAVEKMTPEMFERVAQLSPQRAAQELKREMGVPNPNTNKETSNMSIERDDERTMWRAPEPTEQPLADQRTRGEPYMLDGKPRVYGDPVTGPYDDDERPSGMRCDEPDSRCGTPGHELAE